MHFDLFWLHNSVTSPAVARFLPESGQGRGGKFLGGKDLGQDRAREEVVGALQSGLPETLSTT